VGASTSNNYKQPFQNNYTNDYNHNKLLLFSGPPGCGKTTLARVVARHCGYDVVELNASDDRSANTLITKIEALGKTNSISSGKPTMIIIDEVDGALEQEGNGIK
jgi:DNA polymerase III delta prime subunit